MDIFKGVQNFFRGAFGGESEEEKKRKQREAQQKKQQAPKPTAPKPAKVNTVPQMFGVKDPKADPFKVKPPTAKAPVVKAPVVKAPVVAPPVAPAMNDAERAEKAKQISAVISGKKYNPAKNYLTKADYDAAVKKREELNKTIAAGKPGLHTIALGLGDAVNEIAIKPVVTSVKEAVESSKKSTAFRKQLEKETGSKIIPGATNKAFLNKNDRDALARVEKKQGVTAAEIDQQGIEKGLNLFGNLLGIEEIPKLVFNTVKTAGKQVLEDGGKKVLDDTVENFKTAFDRDPSPDELNKIKEEVVRQRPTQATAVDDTAKATDETTEALRQRAEDPGVTALDRKRAKEAVDEADAAARKAEFDADPTNVPAYQAKRQAENIVRQEEDNLNRYFQENPNLTRQQMEAATEAAKARVTALVDDLKASRQATTEAVDADQLAAQAAAEQRTAANAQVVEERVASGTPQAGDRVQTPASPDAEDLANDAYATQYNNTADMTDAILKQADVDFAAKERGGFKTGLQYVMHKMGGGLISDPYKKAIDKIRDTTSDVAYNLAEGNAFQSALGRGATLFGNNAVLKDSVRQVMRIRNDMQSAAGDAVKRLHDNISDKVSDLNMPPAQFNQLLDEVFESPEFLARKYGDGTPNVSVESLPPEVRAIVDQLIEANKLRNLQLYRQGKITIGEYKMFEDGMHSPRLYDFEKQSIAGKGNKLIDTTSTQKRKELSEISDETFEKLIDSPAQRMLIRLEMAMRSGASHDALKAYDEAGMLLSKAPNNQFSKLEGARWGQYQGKYVYNPIKGQLEDSIVMNTEAGQNFSNIVDAYRNSPFGTVDRFFKKTKTVYNPGTFIGNVLSNPILFNAGAGVNAIGQSRRMVKAGADLALHRTGKKFDRDIYEAQKHGVFASDTGKQITGENNPQLTVANNKRTNVFEATYGGADDAAKLAIYRGLRGRGVSPELAARRVSQFTQDYNNAGRLVRTLADMPVIGKPFARFAPELVRLVKNNVLYNPVGMVAGAGTLALIQNKLSEDSGETPEEREARETGMGQSLIPGTAWLNRLLSDGKVDRDISLNFPIPDKIKVAGGELDLPGQGSAVNIARAIGLNFPVDETGDPRMALIRSITPWAIPTRTDAQGDIVFAPEELFTSMAISPIAQEVANRDFMGRQITDPTNKTYYEGENGNDVRKYAGKPAEGEEMVNRLKHLFMSYTPLANEGGSLAAAMNGDKDYFGKERTVPEAIARIFGAKTESNTEENQAERVETKQYFEEDLKAVQGFVRDNPDLADAYFKLKNPSRTRPTDENDPGTKVSDLVTPEKWDIINSDTSGRLFNFLKEQNIKQSRDDGKPLDPVFRLSPENAKYVQELRSRPSGDDVEAQDILRATSSWYGAYEDAYFKYLEDNNAFFDAQPKFPGAAKPNARVEEYGNISVPIEQPEIMKEYYRIKEQDPEAAKVAYQNNKEALSAAFDVYGAQKLERINKLRKIEGYEPISLEVYKNKTFGFDVKGGGSGYGSGGGGGGGGGAKDVNNLGELTSFANSVEGYAPVQVQEMPNTVALFQKLMATKSGGRAKPRIGASSSGT